MSASPGLTAISSAEPGRTSSSPGAGQSMIRRGRLKTLGRMGLASVRQPGVWLFDAELEPKPKPRLRRLGERADTYKMMQRALAEARIDRGGTQLALFERGRRQ